MQKRLKLARSILSEKGAVFIQISDIELAQLRLLCDSVFGEENFINIISVNMKNIAGASGGGEDKKFKKNCEYILIYAKNYDFLPIFNNAYKFTELYDLVEQYRKNKVSWKYTSVLYDSGLKEYICSTIDGDGNEIKIYKRTNYEILSIKQIANKEKISEKEVYYKYIDKIFQTAMPQSSIRPRVIEKINQLNIKCDLISIEYIPKTGRNKGNLYEQFYKGENLRLFAWLKDVVDINEEGIFKKDLQGTYWDFVGSTKNLSKEGNVEFPNGKKSIELLKQIISLYPQDEIVVLDFFAGSGSTGHAVVSQNTIDNGKRKFILCTNNQNNICKEITYRRLYNVINGYTNAKGKKYEPIPATLKYYKVDYVPISEHMYYEYADELLLHIRELVEL